MTATTHSPTRTNTREHAGGIVLKRRTIDSVLIGTGAVVAVAMFVAGGLLLWGASFADDYVYDELSSQQIFFPPEEALVEQGRDDLTPYADEQVTTGKEAEAYASFIDGHLEDTADGQTYAELGNVERAAAAAVEEATASGAADSEITALQADADAITEQRNTLFKGETLRGLLLSAYAWSTVGRIAGYAAWAAVAAGAVMVVLVGLGIRHHHKVVEAEA